MVQRAYSYLRFSTPEQSKGDSYRRQFEAAARYAATHGLELDDELTLQDLGVSAFKGKNLEVGRLGHFLTLVEEGLIPQGSYLLVESLDRISRQSAIDALSTLQSIVAKGVTLVTLLDQREYSRESLRRDPFSLMAAVMTFIRANDESVTKGVRVRAAWDAKRRAAAERPLTKVCPGWLRLRDDRSAYEVIPERGLVVARIFELAASGVGQHSIALTLNRDGVPTFGDHNRRAPARHWHRSYVSKILTNPAAVGTFIPHGSTEVEGKTVRVPWEPIRGYFPSVVDDETARRAALVLQPGRSSQRGRHAATPVRNLLAGLAKCPLCSGTMTRVSKGSRKKAGLPYLVCADAKAGVSCRYHAVRLSHVEDALRSRADELTLKETLEDFDPELDDLRTRLDGIQLEIVNLTDAVARSGASEALLTALGRKEAEQRALRHDLDTRTAEVETQREPLVERRLSDLRVSLKADPFDAASANAALRLCANGVTVDFIQGELYVAWRHGGTTSVTFGFPLDEQQVQQFRAAAA
jgi:DNA invertase Pin-like site-specific DNA recombinase